MIKAVNLILFLLIAFSTYSQKIDFDNYFESKSLRIDYIHGGNHESESYFLEQLKEEPYWGGSKVNLIDTFFYGAYYIFVKDSATGNVIYSRGYSSLFMEWQSTPEAKKTDRSFYESMTIPYPKNAVVFEIHKRQPDNSFKPLFILPISPNDYFIKQEKSLYTGLKIYNSGDPSTCVDVVFIPEGYTKDEMDKFQEDARKMSGYLLNLEPFKNHKNKFNFWGVNAPSQESGTDVPGKDIWKNTVVNSNFYTFDSERYLTTQDIKSVRDLASCVPYDQIYILVNTNKYGGGGIYNYYSLTSVDHIFSDEVFAHEFGHGFAGLGDEYYTSEVSVEDFYTPGIEPWEPNVTNRSEFEKKWQDMIHKKTPIPTPMDEKYYDKVGLFEGAGYCEKGMYRPYYDCTMKSLSAKEGFCPVCRRAIEQMIEFYTK